MKVTVVQPTVPHYRVPLFDALARQPGLSLTVVSASGGHGGEDAGHVSGMSYLDDNHPWRHLLPGGALLWQRGLSQVVLGESGDVLLVCGNLRYLSNFPLMWRARRKGVGVVWWGHGRSLHAKSIVEGLRWQVMNWVDSVLLYTDGEVEDYVQRGFSKEKLFATNNAIDTQSIERAKMQYDDHRLHAFRARQRLDVPTFLYCGRLKPASRLDLAIAAVADLNRKGYMCDLVVIGEGEIRGVLEGVAQELGNTFLLVKPYHNGHLPTAA